MKTFSKTNIFGLIFLACVFITIAIFIINL